MMTSYFKIWIFEIHFDNFLHDTIVTYHDFLNVDFYDDYSSCSKRCISWMRSIFVRKSILNTLYFSYLTTYLYKIHIYCYIVFEVTLNLSMFFLSVWFIYLLWSFASLFSNLFLLYINNCVPVWRIIIINHKILKIITFNKHFNQYPVC